MKIVILATRISGLDGVSLEAEHWGEVLQGMGHKVKLVAGALDREGVIIPELHFNHPEVVKIHDRVVYGKENYKKVEAETFALAGKIEGKLRQAFYNYSRADLLIVPNALSLPMHFPLAVALSRVIEELNIPTIARHHDFWWERKRFLHSSMFEFFKRWFPPNLPNIQHVVINSLAQGELKNRLGIASEVIWDSFNFDNKLNIPDTYSKNFRGDFDLNDDDVIFLQASRIVPRKRIELSIELVRKLRNPKVVLVIAGHAGDEAGEYEKHLRMQCRESGIRHKFVGKYVNSRRRVVRQLAGRGERRRVYTLWDAFVNSDFVTYPTKTEGFGNQFVESVYFKKPIILTPYSVYKKDIKPLGFSTIEMSEKIGDNTINQINSLIASSMEREKMVESNFKLGERYFSYKWVEKKFEKIFKNMKLD